MSAEPIADVTPKMGKTYKHVGDLGEYYVAYKLTRLLRSPCRLIPFSDIGIDAEIELCDQDGFSHGKIVKCQIKSSSTTDTKGNFKITQIKKEDLAHWAVMNCPVIVIFVDLSDETKEPTLFWKHIRIFEDKSRLT